MKGKRVLGIDYGRVRIGLALADSALTFASPIGYLINKGFKKNSAAFADLITKHDIGCAVVGLPLLSAGNAGEMAGEVRRFGDWLGNEFGIEIIYHDERLSSWAAEQEIREKMGIKDPKKIRELVDTTAASMILYDWLKECGKDNL